MSTQDRGKQLLDKVADSKFAQDVLGPKVIKPVSEWYEGSVVGDKRLAPDTTEAADVVIEPRSRTITKDAHPTAGVQADLAAASAAVEHKTATAMDGAKATAQAAAPAAPAKPRLTATERAAERKRIKQGADAKPPSRMKRFMAVFKQVRTGIKQHNLVVVAAGIAFWGLLAIPAVLTAALSIYGMVADPDKVESQIQDNLSSAPEEVQEIITEQLQAVAGASGGSLAVGAVIGILLALWTSSGAMAKLLGTFNTIWGLDETRKFPVLRGTALLLTFGGILFLGAAVFLLAALPAVLDAVGMGTIGRWVLNITRFPVLLFVMAVGLSALYWLGPNRKRKYKPVTIAAGIATVLWVLISGAFSVYTATFASYNETYGTLGALVVLLLWLFITAFMVLVGGEIEAANEGSLNIE